MNKFFKFSTIILLLFLLAACKTEKKSNIDLENTKWEIETFAKEETVFDNDITMRFKGGEFELEDRNNAFVERGKYETKYIYEDGIAIILHFESLKEPVIATCDVKYDEEDNAKLDLLFKYRNYIYSLVGKYKNKLK